MYVFKILKRRRKYLQMYYTTDWLHGQLCHSCNTCVVVLVYYMAKICVLYIYLLDMYYYTCISTHVIGYTPVLHMYYICRIYTCITCVKHVYCRYSTHVLQVHVYELHV